MDLGPLTPEQVALVNAEVAAEEYRELALTEWESRHVPVSINSAYVTGRICRACSHRYPCPTAALIAALRASRAEVDRLREGLDFYANPENWEPVLIRPATPGGPNEWASEWSSPEAMDGGDIARRALNVPLP